MEKTILVAPHSAFTGVVARKRPNCKTTQYVWFDKFQTRHITPKDGDEVDIKELERKTNKLDDVFELRVSDITPHIMKYFRYVQRPIDYDEHALPIDPYIFGLWLGDGHSRTPSLTTIDIPVGEAWDRYVTDVLDLRVRWRSKPRVTEVQDGEYDAVWTIHVAGKEYHKNTFLDTLRTLGVYKNKHIPDIYLHNSKENRLKLLAGLIDTDGGLEGACYNISQENTALAEGIVELAQGLGFYTTIRKTMKKCTNSASNPDHVGEYNKVSIFNTRHAPRVPLLLERKQNPKTANFPKFDTNGDPIMRMAGQKWTHEDLQTLYNAVETFKVLEPGQTIPWTMLHKIAPTLERFPHSSLQTRYKELTDVSQQPESSVLLNPKNALKIKRNLELIHVEDRTCLVDDEWMGKYKHALETYEKAYQGDRTGKVGDKVSLWMSNQTQLQKYHKFYKIKTELLAVIQEIIDTRPKGTIVLQPSGTWHATYDRKPLGTYDTRKQAQDAVDTYLLDPEKFVVPLRHGKPGTGCVREQNGIWRAQYKKGYVLICVPGGYLTKKEAQDALKRHKRDPAGFVAPPSLVNRNRGRPVWKLDKTTSERLCKYNSIDEAYKAVGGKGGTGITRTCQGKQTQSYGYGWQYAEGKKPV